CRRCGVAGRRTAIARSTSSCGGCARRSTARRRATRSSTRASASATSSSPSRSKESDELAAARRRRRRRLVPEHDLPVSHREEHRRLSARRVAAMLRPPFEREDDDHTPVAAGLDRVDAAAARQLGVPSQRVGARRELQRRALHHGRPLREQRGRRIVVVPVEGRAPRAGDLLRGPLVRAPAAGERGQHQYEGRRTHADSLPPVDFELTPEQREIRGVAREVALAEIEPHAAEWDRAHGFPRSLLDALGALGLLGVCVPEKYGGAGADFVSYILVLEELSRADAGVGVTVAVHTSACTLPILAFGTDAQRARFVPPLARGEQVGCFALTEPGAGSDAGALVTRAEPAEGGWHVVGAKQWITNAAFGGPVLLFARTDPETRT